VEDLGDVKGVSSGITRFESSVENVVGEVSLSSLSIWVSGWEDRWLKWRNGWLFGVEEGSVQVHGEEVVVSDLWSSILRVVEGNSSKEWDQDLVSVFFEFWVNCLGNDISDGALNSRNNLWDEGALDEWDKNVGNLSNETT